MRTKKSNLFKKVQKVQEKALRTINFLPNTTPVNKIYKNSKILNISDYISLQNALFARDCFNANLPETFSKYFVKTEENHHFKTPSISKNGTAEQEVNTETYENNSVKYQSIKIWKTLQKELKNDLLHQSRSKAKETIIEYFPKTY